MIEISPLIKSDLQDAINSGVSVFGENYRQWAENVFPAHFSKDPYRPTVLVAKLEGKLVGSVQCSPLIALGYYVYGISWLFVLPEYQKKGYSSALMKAIENHIDQTIPNGKSGSIILSSSYDPEYYKKFGYIYGFDKHNGIPILYKNILK